MRARTIAVANEKGGVGKTVTVINLAAALTRSEKRVLVVDMDPQANATRGLGIELPEQAPSVYDLIRTDGNTGARDVVVATPWDGLEVIPSHVDLSGAEVELTDVEGRENRLKDALSDITADYDFILLDTPPSLSLLTVNVFTFARHVLIPCQTHPYAYAALEELFDTINAVKDAINADISILGIVATFCDARTRVSQRILNLLREDERYRPLLFNALIRSNTTIAESADAGKPVVFFRRSSYGAIDYNRLADELLDRAG